MIRLREFNMAELEYFIDPEAEQGENLSAWDDVVLHLLPADEEPVSMTLNVACERASSATKPLRNLLARPTTFFAGGH